MSVTVDISQLKGIVTCAICLDTMSDPKCLQCDHSYCKRCLDGLLQFNSYPAGSANIKCPKCSQSTPLSCTQTTNDLRNEYIARDVVDVISQAEGSSSESMKKCDLCSGDVVKYCVYCNTFLCVNCDDPHDKIPDSFEVLNFDKREMQFSLYCKEHKTDITSICCGQGVCVYCLNRRHKGHNCKGLDELEQSMKKELMDNIKLKADIELTMKNIGEELIDTEKELREGPRKKDSKLFGRIYNFFE